MKVSSETPDYMKVSCKTPDYFFAGILNSHGTDGLAYSTNIRFNAEMVS